MHVGLIAVVGPTASGKTKFSQELNEWLVSKGISTVIISADARQIYRECTIGTSKPAYGYYRTTPVFGLDFLHPDTNYSVYQWLLMAREIWREAVKTKSLVIVVGGTGLYIDGLLHGRVYSPEPSLSTQDKEYLNASSPDILLSELDKAGIVPENLDRKNIRRVRRLWTKWKLGYTTSLTIKECDSHLIYSNVKTIYLRPERSELYAHIEKKVKEMFENGFVEEVEKIRSTWGDNIPALSGIGYKEIVSFLKGECSYDEAVALTIRATRRYAKRQYTWFDHHTSDTIIKVLPQEQFEKEKLFYQIAFE